MYSYLLLYYTQVYTPAKRRSFIMPDRHQMTHYMWGVHTWIHPFTHRHCTNTVPIHLACHSAESVVESVQWAVGGACSGVESWQTPIHRTHSDFGTQVSWSHNPCSLHEHFWQSSIPCGYTVHICSSACDSTSFCSSSQDSLHSPNLEWGYI